MKIILGVLALGIFLNAFAIDDIISPAKADHNTDRMVAQGYGSSHVTIDNWPQGLKN